MTGIPRRPDTAQLRQKSLKISEKPAAQLAAGSLDREIVAEICMELLRQSGRLHAAAQARDIGLVCKIGDTLLRNGGDAGALVAWRMLPPDLRIFVREHCWTD